MPRVYTRTAGKDYPDQGIKKGDTYYAWAFFRSRERKSLTRPTRQQLTQRDELICIYDAEDAFGKIDLTAADAKDTVEADLESVLEQVQGAIDAAQEKLDNLEQGFPNGCPQIEELNDFISGCEEVQQELEGLKDNLDEHDALPELSWP